MKDDASRAPPQQDDGRYGGDCNLTFTDRCEKFIAGRRLIDEQRFWSRPYNSMDFGYGAPEIVLATYAWP